MIIIICYMDAQQDERASILEKTDFIESSARGDFSVRKPVDPGLQWEQ